MKPISLTPEIEAVALRVIWLKAPRLPWLIRCGSWPCDDLWNA